MEITFQGLNPVVSFAFLALLAGIVFLLSWWSYSYLTTITPFKRWSLITFRGTALLILIVLLLNPFIRVDEIEVKKPEIAVYLDDSKSMSVTRGQYDGWNSYGQIIDSFEFDGIPEVNFRFYRFAGNVTPVEDTELELEGSDTNLDNVIRHMRDHSGQSVAGILFSDGIITRGRMPVYNASELSISLFTIPVGDTTQIRDIAITDLFTNETGYTNTRQPVDVSVTQNGFTNETATVQLLQNDRILEETELRFQNDPTSHSLSFELEIEETGLHNFEIFIPVLEGEATAENNRYPFSVEVLDDKTRVVHFAFEIHPDVRALRTILQTDQSLELTTRTWLGNRFSEGPLQTLDDDIDLVIIHGVPPSGLNDFELFYEQYPVLQFSTPALSAVNLNRAVIPMRISGSGSVFDIRPRFAESAETHPVLELDPVNFSRMPVLNTLYADYSVPVTTTVLLKATFEDTPADIPLLTLEETGNVRHSMVNAFNWYRYTQSSNEQARNFAKTLMTNLISWTSTDPDRRNLNISPVKRVFQENDEIQFRASLTKETG